PPMLARRLARAAAAADPVTLSLHDALAIWGYRALGQHVRARVGAGDPRPQPWFRVAANTLATERISRAGLRRENTGRHKWRITQDRKSTRLNSSHVSISYAVFCLKKNRNNF